MAVRPWLKIAHRGASGSAPELTAAAFDRALALGVDMIELDVQFSRDEEVVVIHDLELRRTTDGAGLVRDHDLATLKKLDAGRWYAPQFGGQRIPTLQEVIELVGRRARLNVELKAPSEDWPRLAVAVVDILRKTGRLRQTVVSCFETEALLEVRRQDSEVPLGVLWDRPDFDLAWKWATEIRAASIHPYWALAFPEIVAEAHARQLDVFVWTVNDTATMRRLLEAEVDGIMSDFPEYFAHLSPARGSLDSTDRNSRVPTS